MTGPLWQETVHVDPARFRAAMGRFATGVTLLTAQNGAEVHAMTVNAFTSVSLSPPLVLVCIHRHAGSHGIVRAARVFGVNVLGVHQLDLARRFSGPHRRMADPFQDVTLRRGRTGVPLLSDVQAYVECRLEDTVDAGDHTIFLGGVEAVGVGLGEGLPLVFHGGQFHRLGEALAM